MALVWILVAIVLFLLLFSRTASESPPMDENNTDWLDYCVFASDGPVSSTYMEFRPNILLSNDPVIQERQDFAVSQAERFGADPNVALAIIRCEGGFSDPGICNRANGCSHGSGAFQFIESTWYSTIKRMGDLLPERCKIGDMRKDFECNVIAGCWLLATDGIGHWETWSGNCWKK